MKKTFLLLVLIWTSLIKESRAEDNCDPFECIPQAVAVSDYLHAETETQLPKCLDFEPDGSEVKKIKSTGDGHGDKVVK